MKGARIVVSAILLGSTLSVRGFPSYGFSMVSPRPQTCNGVWDARNDYTFIYQNQVKSSHLFDLSLNFAQSFQPEELATIIFGDSSIRISGSMLPNRNPQDLMADQFGLSPTFASTTTFTPLYRSVVIPATAIFDLHQYIGCHAYVRVTVPFVWASTNLGVSEDIAEPQENTPFPAGYFGIDPVTSPITSFTQALQRNQAVGALTEPLNFGRITCEQSDGQLANIIIDLGINPIFDDVHSLGLFVRLLTPNGNRPHSKYLFEPFVGNGHHWELGVGLKGHHQIWCNGFDHEFSIYLSLVLTHVFKARQRRAFDLCGNGFWSRYLLVKEFDETGTATGTLAPLINYSALPCKVEADLQLDGVFMATYLDHGLHFDFGYEVYLRTQEKIHITGEIPNKTLGLKGVQDTYDVITMLPTDSTESIATIFGPSFDQQDIVVDNPSPRFVSTAQLNPFSAASPQILTQKIFAYLGYQWDVIHRGKSIQPYIGFGTEIEFQCGNEAEAPIGDVDNNTLCQWNLQWRGGFLFG